MNTPKALPKMFFRADVNYCMLQTAMRRLKCTGRELPDVLINTMSECRGTELVKYVHICHWHQLTDFEGRTVRDMLKMNKAGDAPKQRVRNYDLLQYLSLCMQVIDEEYAEYVQNWSYRQVMCLDDIEEEL